MHLPFLPKNIASKKKFMVLFAAWAVLFLSSCAKRQVGFVTSTHNMPFLKERNEGRVMPALGYNHSELQASYSPIKYVGLMGNYYRGHFKYEPKKNYSAEIGGGLYLPIGKHLVLEAYSLYINTRLQRSSFHVIPSLFSEHVGAASRSINLKYIGNSNQFDIGYLFFDDNNISHCIGLGVKLSRIQYDFFHYDRYIYLHYGEPDEAISYEEHATMPSSVLDFMAYSGTYRLNMELVSAMVQYSFHENKNGFAADYQNAPFYRKSWLTLSVEFHIGAGCLKNKEHTSPEIAD
jgi:hypothetical protein